MVKSLSFLLIALVVSTPAHAEVFSYFSPNVAPEQVVEGPIAAPSQSTITDGGMYGYPFYSGCCEPKSCCADQLWAGYCGSKGCWRKSGHHRHRGHCKGGCDTGCGKGYGYNNCGKGGCAPAPCARGHKSHWRQMSYRGHCGKGGCNVGNPCGSKGCNPCDPCAKKHHCRLGLFDWMHYGRGHGHGCKSCGGVGCSSCGGGKGGYIKGGYSIGGYKGYSPAPTYNESYYGTPTEANESPSLQPPEVLVEPTTEVSDRSAWRMVMPANPFARPLSY